MSACSSGPRFAVSKYQRGSRQTCSHVTKSRMCCPVSWRGAVLVSAQLSADAGGSCFHKHNVQVQFKQTFLFKKSELSSKCLQLLAVKLRWSLKRRSLSRTRPAAAWTSSRTAKASVPPQELLLYSSGWARDALGALPQSIICRCSDSELAVGEVFAWRLAAVLYPLWVTRSSSCRPSWPDTTYALQRKREA